METLPALLALCEGNLPVTSWFPIKRANDMELWILLCFTHAAVICGNMSELSGTNYTRCLTKLLGGVYWFHSVRLSVDCSAVLPFVLGVVTRQKPQFNGSVVLGADESPWPCGTPSWYTPPYRIWFWVSRRIFIYSHHNTFVLFSKTSVYPSRIPCTLCSAYSSGWVHFVFIHLIKQLQVCCGV